LTEPDAFRGRDKEAGRRQEQVTPFLFILPTGAERADAAAAARLRTPASEPGVCEEEKIAGSIVSIVIAVVVVSALLADLRQRPG